MKLPFILLFGLATAASAQKIQVVLDCTSEDGDTNGMRLCAALRDGIATSPRFQETIDKGFRWTLHVISITTDNTKTESAESVVIGLATDDGLEYYMTNYVMVTGNGRVKTQADTILAALDKTVDEVRKSAAKK